MGFLRDQYQKMYKDLGVDLSQEVARKRRGRGKTSKNKAAMDHLLQIVGTSNLKQDIKRIKGAQTLAGAQRWITTNKKDGVYTAMEEDVDKDGINDILIKDVNGNLVVVNGYTVRKSDYPYRQKFYGLDPEERKDYKSYKEWVRDGYYGPVYDGDGINIENYRYRNPDEDEDTRRMYNSGFKVMKPKSRSPYQLFAKEYVKKIYDYVIDRYQLRTADGKKPNVYVKLVSIAWNQCVLKPVLAAIYGADADLDALMDDQKTLNKLKARKEFKQLIISVVTSYFTHSDSTNGDLLDFIQNVAIDLIDEWYEKTGQDRNPNYGTENKSVEFEPVVPMSPPRKREESDDEDEE